MTSRSDRGIFIQSNTKQLVGAKIAKHAMEVRGRAREHGIPVTIIEVEKIPAFQAFVGKPYRKGNYAAYTFEDLQSFTMTRFMPPEMMGFSGRALVIDPDIFALTDILPLIEMDLGNAAIAACKKNPWDTSVMVLDNTKLTHWKIGLLLNDIAARKRSYEDIAALRDETVTIAELSREWNSLDRLDEKTKMLHTTQRLTQPWKTGLSIDFTFNPVPKLFGFIPRFWVTHPTHYQPHKNREIEKLFFEILRDALRDRAVSVQDVEDGIRSKDLRPDILSVIGL